MHASEDELQSRLCTVHYLALLSSCQYCPGTAGSSEYEWRPCSLEGCRRKVRMCTGCLEHVPDHARICGLCFSKSGRLCVRCHETPAQTIRQYFRCCTKCISKIAKRVHIATVRAESDAYLARIAEQQTWTGREAALQLLLLPTSVGEPLPAYSAHANYMDPAHCRLCLQSLADIDLRTHLQSRHPQYTSDSYRREVLGKTLSEWPQPVTPQILRSRLAAFKKELCDANFRQVACASCARFKRQCKAFRVCFPNPTVDEAPAWLQWSQE